MKMTQVEKIIDYMETHGSITQMEALYYCGCARLASRIFDIKKAGTPINMEMVKVKNRDGSESCVARYSLAEEGEK